MSKKNIERWRYSGIIRKKGAGRKTGNPELETFLISWVKQKIVGENIVPRKKAIINKAREFDI